MSQKITSENGSEKSNNGGNTREDGKSWKRDFLLTVFFSVSFSRKRRKRRKDIDKKVSIMPYGSHGGYQLIFKSTWRKKKFFALVLSFQTSKK